MNFAKIQQKAMDKEEKEANNDDNEEEEKNIDTKNAAKQHKDTRRTK